jgi:hypothetical protein
MWPRVLPEISISLSDVTFKNFNQSNIVDLNGVTIMGTNMTVCVRCERSYYTVQFLKMVSASPVSLFKTKEHATMCVATHRAATAHV